MHGDFLFSLVFFFFPLIFQILREKTTPLAESQLSRAENRRRTKKRARFHVGHTVALLKKLYTRLFSGLLKAFDLFTKMGQNALVPFIYLL